MNSFTRSIIELGLPLISLGKEATREKSIRKGHISTIHLWWARRPLVAARAAIFSSLVKIKDFSEDMEFITRLCSWEGSNNFEILEIAKKQIQESNKDQFKVLDPFAGGGSIPLEALRLGCEAYSLDLNPVAHIIQLCTLYYPQKFGMSQNNKKQSNLGIEVRQQGRIIQHKLKILLNKYYPSDSPDETVLGYIWARTVVCSNPSCKKQFPLIKHRWLAKKSSKRVAISFSPSPSTSNLTFKIEYGDTISGDPSEGTVNRGIARCPFCHQTSNSKYLQSKAQQGVLGQRLLAVITTNSKQKGRHYRLPLPEDLNAYTRAMQDLKKYPTIIPDETAPPQEALGCSVANYGMNTFSKFHNSRQALFLTLCANEVKKTYQRILEKENDEIWAKGVTTALSLAFDRLVDRSTTLCIWNAVGEKVEGTLGMPRLSFKWDFVEVNPLAGATGSWKRAFEWVVSAIDHCAQTSSESASVHLGSAVDLPFPDQYFDAIITDPPYYDNMGYAHLSDLFYVWLKRIIGDLYPDVFNSTLTPKDEEIILNPRMHDTRKEGRKFFEEMLGKAFTEIQRVVKPTGIVVVMFTHSSFEAWENLFHALSKSGFFLIASWPIATEMTAGLRAFRRASVNSTVFLVCRKRESKAPIGIFETVRKKLDSTIPETINQLWETGLGGSHLLIGVMGLVYKEFGAYSKVLHYDGKEASIEEILRTLRSLVAEHTLHRLLREELLEQSSPSTQYYLLWKFLYGNKPISFDEANLLAKAVGTDVSELRKTQMTIKIGKAFRLVTIKDLTEDHLLRRKKEAQDIMSVLEASALWKLGNWDELNVILSEAGSIFWELAQILLNMECDDSTSLAGILSMRERRMQR